MQAFAGKKIVAVGRSMGVARAIVALAHRDGAEVLAVARGEDVLDQLAGEFPSDATLPETPGLILRVMARDVLVLSAGVPTPEYVAGAVVDFVSGRQAGVGVYWAKADIEWRRLDEIKKNRGESQRRWHAHGPSQGRRR